MLDGRSFEGDPLGFGVQGHNCGYRHRGFWIWTHAFFAHVDRRAPSTLEALVYEMPLGLVFRKAVLWHDGQQFVFRNFEANKLDPDRLKWEFSCSSRNGIRLNVAIDGTVAKPHRVSYLKTDCAGTFDVLNNSLAVARVQLELPDKPVEILETSTGAVLEMAGSEVL